MLTYIDCASGVAGDMLLGAMIGLGLPPRELERALTAAFREKNWDLKITHTERRQWPAWSLEVRGDRAYGSIEKMSSCIQRSVLPQPVKKNAFDILARLKSAEHQAHGRTDTTIDPEGLGRLDTLVDVVGTCWGFWKLNIQKPVASPINTGRVAPATAVMLKQSRIPIYSKSSLELATPTGVAVLLQFVEEFKPMPEMRLEKTGYGAGAEDPPDRANVVAIHQGILAPATSKSLETVLLLETVIDDMDPRLYPHIMEVALKAGALDVWWTPIGMKKGRPGIALSVLCRPSDEISLKDILFQESTTLGLRRLLVERWVLPRVSKGIQKIATLPAGRRKISTEFEEAKKASLKRAIPLLKLLK